MPDIEMAPYVLASYIGAWVILIGYLIYLATRMSRISEEVKHLKEVVEKKK